MQTSSFDYILPKDRIAKYPPRVRGETNLLVLDTKTLEMRKERYSNLDKYLTRGDILILNETKVIPARLICYWNNSQKVELFVKENHQDFKNILCIYRGNIRLGDILNIENTNVRIRVKGKKEDGNCEIEFLDIQIESYLDLVNILEKYGHTPIPPYMKREDEKLDRVRYQSEFSKNPGSVAAPTASLNFTNDLKESLAENGVEVEKLTLHCGFGTFKPITNDNLLKHVMHSEYYDIPKSLIEKLDKRNKSSRVCAVGTTVTRSIEQYGLNSKISGEADIFLYPGKAFKYVNTLLTNFHAPRSTPLILLNAFVVDKLSKNEGVEINEEMINRGREVVKKMYEFALQNDFVFLSYGDSCLIL